MRPSALIAPGPYSRDGLWLTCWEWLDHERQVEILADAPSLGHALRDLHDRLSAVPRQSVTPPSTLEDLGSLDERLWLVIDDLHEFARGRHAQATAAYRDAERMEGLLVMPHKFATRTQATSLEMLVRVGETERVERALAEMGEEVRETRQMRVVLATLRLAHDDPEAAADVLAPIIDDSTPVEASVWEIEALVLEAIARDALRDPGASSRALERALDIAEPGGLLLPFLLHPTAELLERHARSRTTHASLLSEILGMLSGRAPAARPEDAEPRREPLSASELRVLRHLPTNLPAPEIAAEPFVSINTIRTHLRNVYAKLGVHSRADAVKRARELAPQFLQVADDRRRHLHAAASPPSVL